MIEVAILPQRKRLSPKTHEKLMRCGRYDGAVPMGLEEGHFADQPGNRWGIGILARFLSGNSAKRPEGKAFWLSEVPRFSEQRDWSREVDSVFAFCYVSGKAKAKRVCRWPTERLVGEFCLRLAAFVFGGNWI
jgi:hypothetical protein